MNQCKRDHLLMIVTDYMGRCKDMSFQNEADCSNHGSSFLPSRSCTCSIILNEIPVKVLVVVHVNTICFQQ